MGNRLILTSYGLTSAVGRKLIAIELAKEKNIEDKKIFLFHEPYYSVENLLVAVCLNMGFKEENIILSGQQKSNDEVLLADYIYVGEGNTFRILSLIRERKLCDAIKKAVQNGSTYIGASAGAMIAGVSVEEAVYFDKNYVQMDDYKGLGIFDGVIIPHYTKAELKRYIRNSPGIEDKYKRIVSVANNKCLALNYI